MSSIFVLASHWCSLSGVMIFPVGQIFRFMHPEEKRTYQSGGKVKVV